jgi:protein TonB
MIEQAPVNEEPKPDDKPKDEPPKEVIGTNIRGDGPPDGFGVGSGKGGGFLGSAGGAGPKGSRWGYYAGDVQCKIANALRSNSVTRSAALDIRVRVWPDPSGRVTRAQLVASTGNSSIDAALKNQVLNGLPLEPPPAGMPMPIVVHLLAKRP